MDLSHKTPAISELVAVVRARYGDRRVRVVDYWPDLPDTIGFERLSSEESMVAVTASDTTAGRFAITVDIPGREAAADPYLGSGNYENCVIDGVLAMIRKYIANAR